LQTASPLRTSPDLAIPLSYKAILRAFLKLTTPWHGECFLLCVFCRVYPKRKDFVGECSSVIIHFNDADS
jgi:hypothetical protein